MRGFLLLITALLLSVILLPIGFLFQIVITMCKSLNEYLFRIAKSIDQLGNVVCVGLFNMTLIKKIGYHFGNEDVTISYVLGMNKKLNTLTWLGIGLGNLLDAIEKDHLQKAINYEQKNKKITHL